MAARSDDVKELRLALVCYGGVSLAIYMHGITKEIYKLVRASRALDADLATPVADGAPSAQAAQDWDSEHVYYQALKQLADKQQLSVTVDIVGGTSAGGINGVCLARGLAQARSLDGFRDLWIDEGSIVNLVERGWHDFSSVFHHPFEALKHTVGDLVHRRGAPLNGDKMSRMLCAAFEGMSKLTGGSPETLLPDGGGIELLVTTTDVEGYDVLVDTGAGGVSNSDKSYRQLMRFAVPVDRDFEGDGPVAALTFAARATSSFPGAFPPVSIAAFRDALQSEFPHLDYQPSDISRHFQYGTEFGATPESAWYVDGGVLDNAPFDHVVDAIATKRAELETSRHLIYIEPDPGRGPSDVAGAPAEPSWLATVHESLSTIPKHKPTLDALEGLRQMNGRIAEVGKIAATQSDEVIDALPATSTTTMSYTDSVANAGDVRAAALTAAGQTFGTYCRLRADVAARTFADGLNERLGYPPDSNEAAFVSGVLTAWIQSTAAWNAPVTDADKLRAVDALETGLTQADISFRDRRARFVANGVNELLKPSDAHTWSPPRTDLVAIKKASWDLVKALEKTGDDALAAVVEEAAAILGRNVLTTATVASDPTTFADGARARLSALFASYKSALATHGMLGSSRALWETMTTRTNGWGPEGASVRKKLLSRYVAFPIWDVLIFPVIALAELPQLTPIHVTRFSPLDATALAPLRDDGHAIERAHKLKGRVLAHFGGFFDREWRENDYLWGRLDAAELILKLLSAEGGVELPDALRDDGFRKILESERPNLSKLDDVITHLLQSLPNTQPG